MSHDSCSKDPWTGFDCANRRSGWGQKCYNGGSFRAGPIGNVLYRGANGPSEAAKCRQLRLTMSTYSGQ